MCTMHTPTPDTQIYAFTHHTPHPHIQTHACIHTSHIYIHHTNTDPRTQTHANTQTRAHKCLHIPPPPLPPYRHIHFQNLNLLKCTKAKCHRSLACSGYLSMSGENTGPYLKKFTSERSPPYWSDSVCMYLKCINRCSINNFGLEMLVDRPVRRSGSTWGTWIWVWFPESTLKERTNSRVILWSPHEHHDTGTPAHPHIIYTQS